MFFKFLKIVQLVPNHTKRLKKVYWKVPKWYWLTTSILTTICECFSLNLFQSAHLCSIRAKSRRNCRLLPVCAPKKSTQKMFTPLLFLCYCPNYFLQNKKGCKLHHWTLGLFDTLEAKYSRMDQVKPVEDSLKKIWSDMVFEDRPYHFKFLKAVFLKFYLVHFWSILCLTYSLIYVWYKTVYSVNLFNWTWYSYNHFQCLYEDDAFCDEHQMLCIHWSTCENLKFCTWKTLHKKRNFS